MKLAYVFPGQGAQSVGMLESFGDNEVVAALMTRADTALGESLTELIAKGPAEQLNLTINTQPCLLAASYAMYAAFRAQGGPQADVMAGHSLGEYSALTAAGVFEFEDAVRLVRYRAQVMQSAVPVGVGTMAVILGLSDEAVAELCSKAAAGEVLEPVNFNSPGQVVIAGHTHAIERAMILAKEMGAKRALPLAISAPFHSSLLQGAADKLRERLLATPMACAQVPVIANVDAQLYAPDESVVERLARQAASPVQWTRTVQTMHQSGVTHMVEFGPGKVLTGLVRRICPEIQVANVNSAASLQALMESDFFE